MEKTDLQIAVEAELGVELCPVFFAQAEQYARRKLEVANRSAGREWGEDGYGDEYLVLLIPDVIREMAFSAYCEKRSAENLAARKAAAEVLGTCEQTLSNYERGISCPDVPMIVKMETLYFVEFRDIQWRLEY